MNESAVRRAAIRSDPGYLHRVWAKANPHNEIRPNENDLRAFLLYLDMDLEESS